MEMHAYPTRCYCARCEGDATPGTAATCYTVQAQTYRQAQAIATMQWNRYFNPRGIYRD